MRLSRLLADPWTAGAGVFVGALATAGLGSGLAVGVLAGVGGYAVGTVVKALTSRAPEDDAHEPPVELPPRGTEARALYERARAAVAELGEVAGACPPGPVREQAHGVQEQARDTLDGTARIAAQVVVLQGALLRVDLPQVRLDQQRLEQSDDTGPAHASAVAAVRSQLAVAERLERAAREAHGQLLAAALGLESLVASLAEVSALSAASGGSGGAAAELDQLADRLTALRHGLSEAEAASRRALTA